MKAIADTSFVFVVFELFYLCVHYSIIIWICIDESEKNIKTAESKQKQIERLEGINEALKEQNQMEWVKRMNSIRSRVKEII